MPLPFSDDLATILNIDEFAATVTYAGDTINGIFDNETVPMDAGGTAMVHQEQPRFTCRTTDVSSIASGQTLVIDGTTYNIIAWLHDGTGVTTIQLEKQ